MSSASPSPSSSSSPPPLFVQRLHPYISYAYLSILITSLLSFFFHCVPVSLHMLVLAISIILIGAIGSLKSHAKEGALKGERLETKDAMMFPLLGSFVLFSLYLIYKFVNKDWINFLVKLYFFAFGIGILSTKLEALLEFYLPYELAKLLVEPQRSWRFRNPLQPLLEWEWPSIPFVSALFASSSSSVAAAAHATASSSSASSSSSSPASSSPSPAAVPAEPELVTITPLFGVSLVISLVLFALYISTGSWLFSNIIAMAFAIQGIELLSLGSYLNGVILLVGLFFYDIFWVFGTEVMVTVAKSFDAPIKLLLPQTGDGSPSMLGLGDIVIPGIFLALLLRYDALKLENPAAVAAAAAKSSSSSSSSSPSKAALPHVHKPTAAAPAANAFAYLPISPSTTPFFFFNAVGYLLGLSTTVAVMYSFKAAQPALLYLVPACLGSSLLVAYYKGEVQALFKYSESELEEASALEATQSTPAESKKLK